MLTDTDSEHLSLSPSSPSDPRLKRGFSNIIENETLVHAARTSVLQDIREDNHHQMFVTFVLPDLTIYPEDFRAFLKKELIESSTLNSLQLAGWLVVTGREGGIWGRGGVVEEGLGGDVVVPFLFVCVVRFRFCSFLIECFFLIIFVILYRLYLYIL